MLPFDDSQAALWGWSAAKVRFRLQRAAMLRTFSVADRLIFLSMYSRDRILPLLSSFAGSHVVIPNGVPTKATAVADAGRGASYSRGMNGYCLYLSPMNPHKNHLALVRGYAEARRRGFTMPLVLAGPSDTPCGRSVRAEISRLGLGRDVEITGAVAEGEAAALIKGADILLFASTCETCPFILLEYLAAGRPIICSCAPPMPEIGGDACEYVDARSEEEWASALMRLAGDVRRRRMLAEAAAERAALYDMDRCVDDTVKALTEW
jgi:glycosyltransferase involved in cell wall biosynthesis